VIRYFAYGSNMASAQMEAWGSGHRLLGPARLDGYRLEMRRRSIRWQAGAADVVVAEGEHVWGALYELPGETLAGLDEKESAGDAYRRSEVEVLLHGREPVVAFTYEVIDKADEELPCAAAYAELILTGARECALPAEYVELLRARLPTDRP